MQTNTNERTSKKRAKRFLIWAFALLVLGFIGLNLLAYRHAYAMMHFTSGSERTAEPEKLGLAHKVTVLLTGVKIPRPHTTMLPTEVAPNCTVVKIRETNGITLGAWYCPDTNSRTLAILFHGYSGEKTGTLPEAKTFLNMGLSVLMVDFRGSGESSESFTTVGFLEAEGVAGAGHYARQDLSCSNVVLHGQSMGAAAILRAVHDCGVRPQAIIVEAVFDEMLTTVRHRFQAMRVPSFPSAPLLVFWGGRQAGFNGFAHNPVDYARSVSCPILFLHGTEDPRARVEEGRRVFAAVPGPKEFIEFAGLGHASAGDREEWRHAVRAFMAKAAVL